MKHNTHDIHYEYRVRPEFGPWYENSNEPIWEFSTSRPLTGALLDQVYQPKSCDRCENTISLRVTFDDDKWCECENCLNFCGYYICSKCGDFTENYDVVELDGRVVCVSCERSTENKEV